MHQDLIVFEKKCPKCRSTNINLQGGLAAGSRGEGEKLPEVHKYTCECSDCGTKFYYTGKP